MRRGGVAAGSVVVAGSDAGSDATLTLTDSLTPSQLAVNTTDPGCTARTRPSAVATATLASLLLHRTRRPGNGLPHRSTGVATTSKDLPPPP